MAGKRLQSLNRATMSLYVLVVAASGPSLWAAEQARPPTWSRDVLDAFFEDAREKLEGERPDYQRQTTTFNEFAAIGGEPAAKGRVVWSKLIDAETIETEVKRLSQSIDRAITTPSAFKGGEYKLCRRDFSVLAVLFEVTGQFDKPARWQDAAAGLRALFARAGFNCRVGTDTAYAESQARKHDLAELVRGGRPRMPDAEAAVDDWSQVAARPPLMQRLEIAHDERLAKWLVDAVTFRRHRDDIRHEAQIVAMLAEVLGREAFDYWDEVEYAAPARELKQAATDLAAAVTVDNFVQARTAIGNAANACTNCHEGYR